MSEKTFSQYAIVFDGRCVSHTRDLHYNLMYLKNLEKGFNDLLNRRGYVFLRDIYEQMGIPITKESCLVGWTKGNCNHIEFELHRLTDVFMVDFNVNGEIIDNF